MLGLVAMLYCIAPCRGTVIPFDRSKKDALLGVKINPTGPQYAPLAPNLVQFPGGEFVLVPASRAQRYYTGNATFQQPIVSVTMTIENESLADMQNDFTLVAYDHHQRIARKTITLAPAGDETRITLAAPEIDKIRWLGAGWTFHSYVITNLNVTFAPTASASNSQVSAPAPEPGFVAVAGPVIIFLLLRRRRREYVAGCQLPAKNEMRRPRFTGNWQLTTGNLFQSPPADNSPESATR
ncbi:MAG TPA: hypothetical protein VFC46_16800 [Humisphaera sp.]|nr:hypothetical protein [Humisphaera sp.]